MCRMGGCPIEPPSGIIVLMWLFMFAVVFCVILWKLNLVDTLLIVLTWFREVS